MKKIIISAVIIVLVVVAYLGQVAYMGKLNAQIFERASQDNDFVSIEDMDFQKGFFTSKATFRLYIKTESADIISLGLGQIPIGVEVRFKNNIFARDNVSVDFENPFYELLKGNLDDKTKMDKNFLSVKASISPFGSVKLTSKFTDIDMQQDEILIKLKNFLIESKMDLSGKIYGSMLNLDEFAVSMPTYGGVESIFVKNLHLDERLDKGLDYAEYLGQGFSAGKTTGSIEQMQIYDVSFMDIKSNGQSAADKDGLIKANFNTTIKSITSPLMQIKLDNISSNIEMSNISLQALQTFQAFAEAGNLNDEIDLQEFALAFFSALPSIELKSLDFYTNEKKITSKGALTGSPKEYSLNFFVESEAVPSEILPPLQFLGINELFTLKDNKYILDFAFHSDYKDIKMSLNGEDISGENAGGENNFIIDVN